MIAGTRADVLFPEKPTLHFYPQERKCPVCGSSLNIQKTWGKEVMTMDIMTRNGGYILHLDGISELVLDSIKIPSEKKDTLIPFFRGIKEKYGEP